MTGGSAVAHGPGGTWWRKLTRRARPAGETTDTRVADDAHYAWLLPGDAVITGTVVRK
ncbi:hypothetical protein [Arthrobacter sp. L77]|uniref:hypothetical protein n=1 Tax=Arthrobacter sp. L77 TaxID=1496689 RepID=UPI000A5E46DB|nr:hypothetical protein [Arthrobacter sp. L77]